MESFHHFLQPHAVYEPHHIANGYVITADPMFSALLTIDARGVTTNIEIRRTAGTAAICHRGGVDICTGTVEGRKADGLIYADLQILRNIT
jgi:hypothetical protein